MKNRQRKKIFKIVARQINSGDFTKLKSVHLRCVKREMKRFFDRKYECYFRRWWYEQFDRWSELDFGMEFKKHIEKTKREFEEWSGIDPIKLHRYYELHHKKVV